MSGEGWAEVSEHFTLNLDEMNTMASMGSTHIIGAKAKKKHEKNESDSRISITTVECGSAAGADGPSMYLMKGDKMPKTYKALFDDRKWLERHGAPRNSFCVLTPAAFMTNAAWDESAEELARGIRQMPVIKDHPNYWVILHLDGFKSHVMTYAAQMMFRRYKIMVVKENSHSSQINQAFDQAPAKQAKAETRRWLPSVWNCPNLIRIMDQWTLLCVFMTGQDGGRKEAWTAGFKRVNLHPKHMMPIEVWLSKISDALTAAGGTELSDQGYGSNFLRLIRVPTFFANLTQEKQLQLKTLTDDMTFDWSKEQLASLPDWCQHIFKNNEKTLVSYWNFSKLMSMSVRQGVAESTDILPTQALERARFAQLSAPKKKQEQTNKERVANAGLGSYKLFGESRCPKERFKHACLHRSRFAGNKLSTHLDLHITPCQERIIMEANSLDFSIGSFLSSGLDVNIGKRLSSRQLNLLGEIDGVACIANSPERLRRQVATC